MTVQPCLCQTWSETQIVSFLTNRLKCPYFLVGGRGGPFQNGGSLFADSFSGFPGPSSFFSNSSTMFDPFGGGGGGYVYRTLCKLFKTLMF